MSCTIVGMGRKTVLSHRFAVYLNPNQVGKYVPATARHELGHALGIWGHSLLETDVLYFSQVRNPPAISARDVNTLKRVYEQPTRLGWGVVVWGRNINSALTNTIKKVRSEDFSPHQNHRTEVLTTNLLKNIIINRKQNKNER